ncbi:hypothetical protein QCA50_007464 [Cerrena zonata]|uniref:Uncharacterized protein n=1 Tax=Cerrena zonata TaxID=2478898 RepID=A0AAW0GDC6_9APHY
MPNFKHPFRTPLVRRYLADLFKPGHASNVSQTLGKRGRMPKSPPRKKSGNKVEINPNPQSDLSVPTVHGHLPNCVALQTDDPSLDSDAIVVTSLHTLPFCCHADLVTMTRPQLLTVAQTLNERLPNALKINTSKPDAFIRNSIEILVGLQPQPPRLGDTVPGAPKAERSFNSSVLLDGYASPGRSSRDLLLDQPKSPISPLASRSRTTKLESDFSFSFGSPLSKVLDVLEEETEEEEVDNNTENIIGNLDRPLKKKRRTLDHKLLFSTPPHLSTKAGLGRSQSQRAPVSGRKRLNAIRSGTSSSTYLGRSQSLKGPESGAGVISRNITLTRGGRSTRVHPGGQEKFMLKFASEVQTSTPKKRKRAPSDSDVEMACDTDTVVGPTTPFLPLDTGSRLPPATMTT